MSKSKPEFSLWGEGNNPGKKVIKAGWEGAKIIGLAVVAGAALGLGLGAMNSASNG